jgi:hypothetical protein
LSPVLLSSIIDREVTVCLKIVGRLATRIGFPVLLLLSPVLLSSILDREVTVCLKIVRGLLQVCLPLEMM